jgi:hypothetical protein
MAWFKLRIKRWIKYVVVLLYIENILPFPIATAVYNFLNLKDC